MSKTEQRVVEEPDTFRKLATQDAKESLSKGRLLLVGLLGVLMMAVGQWIASTNEESAADLIPLIKAASSRDGAVQPPEYSGRLMSKSTARFWGEVIIRIGELFLISIALEVVLHSDHYRAFFLRLVTKAVLGDEVVSKLGNADYIWERLSDTYFGLRFPKIRERLSATLFDYFPTTHPFYLDNYESRYRITDMQGSFIRMDQEITYTLTPAKASDATPFTFGCTVYKRNQQDQDTEVWVTALLVGENDLTAKATFEEKAVDGKPAWELALKAVVQGAAEYRVIIRMTAVWDIDFDPSESFTVSSLVNDLMVSVECADNLVVEWCDLGVKDGFKNLFPAAPSSSRFDKRYTGLVFRNQGYRFSIRKVAGNAVAQIQGHTGRVSPPAPVTTNIPGNAGPSADNAAGGN